MTALPDELDRGTLLEMLRRMAVIRDFETAVEGLIDKGELVGSIHTSSGQEAVCVGAAMAVADDDFMTGHHRSHGHPIGKGADIDALMAELFGKKSGVCKGMGGSMHLADFSVGSLGETAIVASGLPIAVGAALAAKLSGWTKVTIAFFGEGASNAGAFHEALNMAAVWKLPVVFVCENNKYAVTTTYRETSSVEKVSDRAVGYDIRAEVVDGQDVIAVWRAVKDATDRARAGGGPELVEAMTYRYGEHSYLMSNRGPYRTEEEIAEWRNKDPIPLFADRLVAAGTATRDEVDAVLAAARSTVDKAVASARADEYPSVDDLWDGMYVNSDAFKARRHHVDWAATLRPVNKG